jgi:hypothetical protein
MPAPVRPLPSVWPTLCVGALALVVWIWPIFADPAHVLLGDPTSEAMGHLWGLEVVTDGLLEEGPFVRVTDQVGFPDGFRADFMDPVNLVFFAPVMALTGSPGLAWNTVHVGWFVLGLVGSWALARRLAPGESWAAPVLIAAFPLSSYFLAHDCFGRTEYLPVLLLPLHLAWLRDALLGAGGGERRAAFLAGTTLGAMALGGWYLAVFLLLVVPPLALVWTAASPLPWRRRVEVLGLAAGTAIVLVLPAIASFVHGSHHFLETYATRAMPPSDRVGVPGVTPFLHQLRLPIPDVRMLGLDQAAYPGMVATLGALLLALRSPSRRMIAGWLVLLAWLLVWATGIDLVLASDATGRVTRSIAGLPRLLKILVPATGGMTGWNRLGSMVGLFAGVALVRALVPLLARHPGLARLWPVLVVAIALDHATWPRPLELRPRTFDPRAPPDLIAVAGALPPGALLLLPFDIGAAEVIPVMRQHYLLWQRELGHPITGSYGLHPEASIRRSGLADRVLALQEADRLRQKGEPALVSRGLGVDDPALGACLRRDNQRLLAHGVTGIVLLPELPYGAPIEPYVVRWLGPPTVASGRVSGWDLTAVVSGEASDCGRFHLEDPSTTGMR